MGKILDIEQVKLIHEHTKHLTTLSAGSIVVVTTFHEKLGTAGSWRFLFPIALCGLVVSILAGLVAQIGVIDFAVPEHDRTDKSTGIAFIVSWIAFAVSMLAFAAFGAKNF
jgi:hypothetical protein